MQSFVGTHWIECWDCEAETESGVTFVSYCEEVECHADKDNIANIILIVIDAKCKHIID